MAITTTWLEHMGENALSAAAAAALGALGSAVSGTIYSVPWYGVLSAAGFAALYSLLSSCASLRIGPANGTASFLPNVVDRAKFTHETPAPPGTIATIAGVNYVPPWVLPPKPTDGP